MSWTLARISDQETHVELGAEVERAGGLDRALLALGGRLWLGRMLDSALATLAKGHFGTNRGRSDGRG